MFISFYRSLATAQQEAQEWPGMVILTNEVVSTISKYLLIFSVYFYEVHLKPGTNVLVKVAYFSPTPIHSPTIFNIEVKAKTQIMPCWPRTLKHWYQEEETLSKTSDLLWVYIHIVQTDIHKHGVWSLKRSVVGRGFIRATGKLMGCEGNFASWFDYLQRKLV